MKRILLAGLFALAASCFGVEYTRELIEKVTPVTEPCFFDYLRRLGIAEEEFVKAKGQKWLSVGEGHSDFTAKAAERGIDSLAIDALVINKHAPSRSRLGTVRDLPYRDQEFDRVISVQLIDSFFKKDGFDDPQTGETALREMIRVTKKGGDIRINPVNEPRLLNAIEKLQNEGLIASQTLPYFVGTFKPQHHHRKFVLEEVPKSPAGSVRLTRLK